MVKKIAFMTGGGDCAGINAFIAAAVKRGIEGYQAEFVGIRKAFEGAAADDRGTLGSFYFRKYCWIGA